MAFTPQNIVICEQDLIPEIESDSLFIDFFSRILGMEVADVLITDLSALGDFVGAGGFPEDGAQYPFYSDYVKAWDLWAIAKVQAEFGVTLERTTLPFVQLFPLLKEANNKRVH